MKSDSIVNATNPRENRGLRGRCRRKCRCPAGLALPVLGPQAVGHVVGVEPNVVFHRRPDVGVPHEPLEHGGHHPLGPPGAKAAAQVMSTSILPVCLVDHDAGPAANGTDNPAYVALRKLSVGVAAGHLEDGPMPFLLWGLQEAIRRSPASWAASHPGRLLGLGIDAELGVLAAEVHGKRLILVPRYDKRLLKPQAAEP